MSSRLRAHLMRRRGYDGRFVVHEHDATRLHYDFRLEIGGALKSWAVPKGPSMNPAEKRLSVMVADHPLSYIDWEGVIPQGHYGAGPVVVWDAGTYELVGDVRPEAQLRAGKLTFILHGRKLRGRFVLARFAKSEDQWLLMKARDEYADPAWHLRSELRPQRVKALDVRIPPCEGP